MSMEKDFAERMRAFYQNCYQCEYGDNVIAVISKGVPGVYDNNPTLEEYKEKGYRLMDANICGSEGGTFEILVFQKKSS